jgi:hypothetical protein
MRIPRLIITREHGSWAVLLVPFFSGAMISHQWSFNVVWLVLAELCIFLAYVPAQILLRHYSGRTKENEKLRHAKFWVLVNALLAAACAVPLLYQKLWFLLIAGIVGAISFAVNFLLSRTLQKSIAGDFSAVAGLTLGAPCAYYVVAGKLDAAALAVYAFNLLFFGGSVFYVHMKIQASAKKNVALVWKQKLAIGYWNIIYHTAVLIVVIIIVLALHGSLFVVAAFLPMIIHAIYGTLTMESKVRFRNLGFLLLVHSLFFGIVIGLSSW